MRHGPSSIARTTRATLTVGLVDLPDESRLLLRDGYQFAEESKNRLFFHLPLFSNKKNAACNDDDDSMGFVSTIIFVGAMFDTYVSS
jgi:hypothetical protein